MHQTRKPGRNPASPNSLLFKREPGRVRTRSSRFFLIASSRRIDVVLLHFAIQRCATDTESFCSLSQVAFECADRVLDCRSFELVDRCNRAAWIAVATRHLRAGERKNFSTLSGAMARDER